eukprot:scaffold207410_cov26-Prasinocladus_malaysianus.AAC.1
MARASRDSPAGRSQTARSCRRRRTPAPARRAPRPVPQGLSSPVWSPPTPPLPAGAAPLLPLAAARVRRTRWRVAGPRPARRTARQRRHHSPPSRPSRAWPARAKSRRPEATPWPSSRAS